MTPPAPPCRLDIRRTASRAHRKGPTTLACMMRCSRGVHLLHPHLGLQDAGVVHQRGDRSQLAVRGAEQGQDAGFGRHIRAHGDGGAALPTDRVDHRLRAIGARLVVHAHGVTTRGRERGDGGADARLAPVTIMTCFIAVFPARGNE